MTQAEAREALRRLDGGNPGHVDELREALDTIDPTHTDLLNDVLRILDTATDEIVRAQAQSLAACRLFDRGDEARANELFSESVPVLWGSGRRIEVTALINFALLRLGRGHAYEALLLARQAADVAPESAPYAESLAHLYRAGACMHLRDWEAFEDCLLDAAATDALLRTEQRDYIRKVSASFRLLGALESGRAVDTDREMATIAATGLERDSWAYIYHECAAHLLAGRPEEAMRAHARLTSLPPDRDALLHDQGLIRARALQMLGEEESARAQAEALLDELETRGRGWMDAGQILGAATSLAALLRDVGATGHTVWRAYELAGRAALSRIRDLDRLRVEVPQLAWIAADDVALLETHRERLIEHHRGLIEVLGSLLAENATDPPLLGDTVQVGICAWCERVRGPDDVWLPLARFRIPADAANLTHGVCPRCHDKTLREAFV